jgi:hypothetical protein
MSRRSTSPHAFARLALLAMLALSFVLQPALAAIGETHELTHAGAMQADGHVVDQHDLVGQGVGADGQDQPSSPDGDSPWHAALHFAHCCGQVPTVLTSTNLAVPMMFAASVVPERVPRLPLAASVFEPQRPPIL